MIEQEVKGKRRTKEVVVNSRICSIRIVLYVGFSWSSKNKKILGDTSTYNVVTLLNLPGVFLYFP